MKKNILYHLAIVVIPLGLMIFQGCYPKDDLTYEQTDVVMTAYNDSVDFNSLSTYFMSDTVYILDENDEKVPVDNQDIIIENLAANMSAAGYTRITSEEQGKPDVVLLVGAFTSTTTSVGWWYPYYPGWGWGGYPGWGYGGWGGYYPGGYYPPYPVYTSYTTGTIIWDMANPDDYDIIKGDTVARVYWNGGVQGVLSGKSTDARIKKGIDQAFAQSPEIKTNK